MNEKKKIQNVLEIKNKKKKKRYFPSISTPIFYSRTKQKIYSEKNRETKEKLEK